MTWEIRVKSPTGHSMAFTEEALTAWDALEQFKKRGRGCAAALKRSGGIICVFPVEAKKVGAST